MAAIEGGTPPKRKSDADLTTDPTVREFADVYLEQYCKIHNKRPDCKEQVLESVTEILGNVRVKSLRRADAHHFITERSKEVGPATVNRGMAVLKNMLTFALEREIIDTHPLLRFRMLKEDRPALRVMTLREERRLIECIEDPVIAVYAAVLGETGLRKQEGLLLKWDQVNLDQGMRVARRRDWNGYRSTTSVIFERRSGSSGAWIYAWCKNYSGTVPLPRR